MEWPASTARRQPAWSSTAIRSSTWAAIPEGPPTPALSPRPRRSGARTVTASPRWRATGAQDRCDPVMPCTASTTGTPSVPGGGPATPTCNVPPATGTSRALRKGCAMRPAFHNGALRVLGAALDHRATDGHRGRRAGELEVLDGQVGHDGGAELGAHGLVVQHLEEGRTHFPPSGASVGRSG